MLDLRDKVIVKEQKYLIYQKLNWYITQPSAMHKSTKQFVLVFADRYVFDYIT